MTSYILQPKTVDATARLHLHEDDKVGGWTWTIKLHLPNKMVFTSSSLDQGVFYPDEDTAMSEALMACQWRMVTSIIRRV